MSFFFFCISTETCLPHRHTFPVSLAKKNLPFGDVPTNAMQRFACPAQWCIRTISSKLKPHRARQVGSHTIFARTAMLRFFIATVFAERGARETINCVCRAMRECIKRDTIILWFIVCQDCKRRRQKSSVNRMKRKVTRTRRRLYRRQWHQWHCRRKANRFSLRMRRTTKVNPLGQCPSRVSWRSRKWCANTC